MAEEILMFAADDSPPKTGFYAVRLRKGCAMRALGVSCVGGWWIIYLDGDNLTTRTPDWKEAFGNLFNLSMLKGTKITAESYMDLVTLRQTERLNGVDVNKPINHSQTRIAI